MRINAKRESQLDALAVETIAACIHKFVEGQRLLDFDWAKLTLIEYDSNLESGSDEDASEYEGEWYEALVLKTGRGEPPELGGDTLMVLDLNSGRLEVGA